MIGVAKNIIEKNYRIISSLENRVDRIENNEEKLGFISMIGMLYASCTTGVYSSNYLEHEIIKCGECIDFEYSGNCSSNKVLHVMTEASYEGGHTRIVSNWLRWTSDQESSIVFTDQNPVYTPEFLKYEIKNCRGKLLYLDGNYIEKAKQLLDISKDYSLIVLHVHMYDVIPVLAYGNKNWRTPVCFFNHADFRFSFGFCVSDVVLNLTDFDVKKSIEYRGVDKERSKRLDPSVFSEISENNSKITIASKDKIRRKYKIDMNEKLIVSMGADYKYEDVEDISFSHFVRSLLQEYEEKCKFLIIGADPCRKKWKNLWEATEGRGRATGTLDPDEAESIIAASDLYISSFPMTATGALVAQKHNVPNLTYLVTERGAEFYGDNKAFTLDELLKKSLDALNGNRDIYVNGGSIASNKEDWRVELGKIVGKLKTHRVYEINSVRKIQQHELINCALMEQNASKWISAFLARHVVSNDQFVAIREAEQIENKSILPGIDEQEINYRNVLNNKKMELLSKWLRVNYGSKSVSQYIKDMGWRIVVIYGMGDIGEALWRELRKEKLEVICGIDRNARNIVSGLRVIAPESIKMEMLPESVVILNTTVYPNADIKKGCCLLKDRYMVSINQILNNLLMD